jgi:lipopolysaccharide transport system permease protein
MLPDKDFTTSIPAPTTSPQSTVAETLEDDDNNWDLVIEPKGNLLDLNYADVWKYRDLLWLFVRRDFIAQYKQTLLGPLWHFIQPFFTTVIFLLVFSKIAKIPTQGVPPALFYMSGITIWNYFASCLSNTSNTFVANAGIFGKVYFPRLVLPLSIVMSNIVRFGIQFGLLLCVAIWFHFHGYPLHFGVQWLLIPFLVIIMAGIGLGLGIIISSLTTKYRDFAVLLGFAIQLGMYVTPVAYPLSYLQDSKYGRLIQLNPLTSIVELFRYAVVGQSTFTIGSIAYSVIFMLVVFFVGSILFTKVEKTFMDTV